ncbi:hypothetical protein BDW68DRAFT_106475 [Aspergillus falconensis]
MKFETRIAEDSLSPPLWLDQVMEGRPIALRDSRLLNLPSESLSAIVGYTKSDKETLASLALVNSDCRQLARSCQSRDVREQRKSVYEPCPVTCYTPTFSPGNSGLGGCSFSQQQSSRMSRELKSQTLSACSTVQSIKLDQLRIGKDQGTPTTSTAEFPQLRFLQLGFTANLCPSTLQRLLRSETLFYFGDCSRT